MLLKGLQAAHGICIAYKTKCLVLLKVFASCSALSNMQEASTLLSGLATALSNCRVTWPAFVPVHDPLRDAYWGIAATANTTAHYDTDSIHISKNPTYLQKVSACHSLQHTQHQTIMPVVVHISDSIN